MDFSLIILIFTLQLLKFSAAEFCFKKIHGSDVSDPSIIACRGHINKQVFQSLRSCCDNEHAAGYYSELIPLGKRKKKWRCIPCPEEADVAKDLIVVGSEEAGWSSWGDWSACSVTCSIGTKTRQRICQDKVLSNCEGEASMMLMCSERSDCPVDGNWGPWSGWSDCTKSCSGGSKGRLRRCNNPAPNYGGKDCEGNKTESESCNDQGCPVDGGWSSWASNGGCSVTCGNGKLTNRRTCDNPLPQHEGKYCPGSKSYTEQCSAGIKCPVDGQWSLWTRYTSCTGSCGQGSRQRYRECVAPNPRHGGRECIGAPTDAQVCYSHNPCPVDGSWSDWGGWGVCLAKPCSNDTGLQIRSRTCSNPQPRFRGKMCEGVTTETQRCYYNENCPVHGGWCDWQPYSECRKSENNKDFRLRVRDCNCPVPNNGGNTCRGDDYEIDNCAMSLETKSKRCGKIHRSLEMEGSGNLDDDDDEEPC